MNTTIKITKENGGVQIDTTDLPIGIREKNGNWIVFSPVFKTLGFSTQNEEDAIQDFFESLDFFFKLHVEDNTLQDALQEFQWERVGLDITEPLPPVFTIPNFNPIYNTLPKKSHKSNVAFA